MAYATTTDLVRLGIEPPPSRGVVDDPRGRARVGQRHGRRVHAREVHPPAHDLGRRSAARGVCHRRVGSALRAGLRPPRAAATWPYRRGTRPRCSGSATCRRAARSSPVATPTPRPRATPARAAARHQRPDAWLVIALTRVAGPDLAAVARQIRMRHGPGVEMRAARAAGAGSPPSSGRPSRRSPPRGSPVGPAAPAPPRWSHPAAHGRPAARRHHGDRLGRHRCGCVCRLTAPFTSPARAGCPRAPGSR